MILFGISFDGESVPFTKVQKLICPDCKKEAMFTRLKGKRFFHVFFLKLFPVGDDLEVIQCGRCKRVSELPSNWNLEDEAATTRKIEEMFNTLNSPQN